MKCYNSLDKQSKKEINENFIKKVKEQKPSAYAYSQFNLQNVINQHVSKSKTRKAIKSIFPPSMYEKYGSESVSKSRSRSKKKRENSDQIESKIASSSKRSQLPPLPEINGASRLKYTNVVKTYYPST